MTHINQVLTFLRLIDDDGRLSLTNIAVWITLAHLAMSKSVVQPTDLGALLTSLASYQVKRLIRTQADSGQ